MNPILILYISCIEYDLKEAEPESIPEPEDDSAIVEPAPPPDCTVELLSAENIDIDQECEKEEYNIENPWNV